MIDLHRKVWGWEIDFQSNFLLGIEYNVQIYTEVSCVSTSHFPLGRFGFNFQKEKGLLEIE